MSRTSNSNPDFQFNTDADLDKQFLNRYVDAITLPIVDFRPQEAAFAYRQKIANLNADSRFTKPITKTESPNADSNKTEPACADSALRDAERTQDNATSTGDNATPTGRDATSIGNDATSIERNKTPTADDAESNVDDAKPDDDVIPW